MDDQNTPSTPVEDTEAPEPVPAPVDPISAQPTDSTPTDIPPTAPESPINAPILIPVEDQNGGVNEPESDAAEVAPTVSQVPTDDQPIFESVQGAPVSAPAAPVPSAPQPQPPAQQDEVGFIHSLLVKAQAKIQSNKQKKLSEIIQLAQKKQTIKNDDVQKLLRVSDATATRYLVKLVEQGYLTRIGSPRDAKYQFVR